MVYKSCVMKNISKAGFVFISGILLFTECKKAACTAQPDPTCICTEQYEPVCGCNGITYGNACMAECMDVDIEYTGECK